MLRVIAMLVCTEKIFLENIQKIRVDELPLPKTNVLSSDNAGGQDEVEALLRIATLSNVKSTNNDPLEKTVSRINVIQGTGVTILLKVTTLTDTQLVSFSGHHVKHELRGLEPVTVDTIFQIIERSALTAETPRTLTRTTSECNISQKKMPLSFIFRSK